MARAWQALGTLMTRLYATAGSESVSGRDPLPPRGRTPIGDLRPGSPPLCLSLWGWGLSGLVSGAALRPRGAVGGRGERPPSPAPRMTGAWEPRREEPPPSARLRSRSSGRGVRAAASALRGRGAAARPATGPPPRRIGPLYGMWLVTFLLLLDSLHKGETRVKPGQRRRRTGERVADSQAGCLEGSRCPGATIPVPGPG